MKTEIADITADERHFLSCLKRRPPLYLGKTNLTNFQMYVYGYIHAIQLLKEDRDHNILPDGMNDFVALKYLGHTQTSHNCFDLILLDEDNEEKAFYTFFDLLDEYLISLGYEPIPAFGADKQTEK